MPSRLSEFHDGEVAMHQLLKAPPRRENPTSPGLPTAYGLRTAAAPLLAVGALDGAGRPWTTLWGGSRGLARPVARDVLGVKADVDRRHDPVLAALWEGAEKSGDEDGSGAVVVRPAGGAGRVMAALAIDLETRDRVKLAGRMVGGATTGGEEGGAEVQLAMHVAESLGNCPKYLNRKRVERREGMAAGPAVEGLPLRREALGLLDRADMFFVSSTDGETMDTNHRGGAPGLVRVVRNEEDEVVLIYPEYSGNRLYQTLGNLKVNPLVGIAVPDFVTSDVLYLTGTASILIGAAAAALLPRTRLAVQITLSAARFVPAGLPLRATALDPSPYNPPLRRLHAEHPPLSSPSSPAGTVATLTRREALTPTIARFTLALSPPHPAWRAGHAVTLDFAPELDAGYAHMRDDDPQSLNDDFVRTFTVSSAPAQGTAAAPAAEHQLQITARRHGPATALLWRANPRAGLEVPVLGFGGADAALLPEPEPAPARSVSRTKGAVFVAGGVGITPVLAQVRSVMGGGGVVLWSLRAEDLGLAVDSFERSPELAGVTRLFVTGEAAAEEAAVERVRELGAVVEGRRMEKGDLEGLKSAGRKFVLCAGQGLLGQLREWLEGEDVAWEDFGY